MNTLVSNHNVKNTSSNCVKQNMPSDLVKQPSYTHKTFINILHALTVIVSSGICTLLYLQSLDISEIEIFIQGRCNLWSLV
jgi:hypothetical protein